MGFYFSNTISNGLNLHLCGHAACEPGYSYGPGMYEFYLLVYIKNGKGIYKVGNNIFTLEKGSSFIMFPSVVGYHKADDEDPWEYIWIGFYGDIVSNCLNTCGICAEDPVIRHQQPEVLEKIFNDMFTHEQQANISSELYYSGLVHHLLSEIVNDAQYSNKNRTLNDENYTDDYIKKAMNFIHLHYASDIDIQHIADHIGLERSYFSKLFSKKVNTSPHKYLSEYRMWKACSLLATTRMPLHQIAYSVGFEYPPYFSKEFKKYTGVTPSIYRRNSKKKW